MRILNWLHGFRRKASRSTRPSCRARLRRRQPFQSAIARTAAVESLEARTLLSAVTWTGGGGDMSWNNAANWSGTAPPDQTDDVAIANQESRTDYRVGSGSRYQQPDIEQRHRGREYDVCPGGEFPHQLEVSGRQWRQPGGQRRRDRGRTASGGHGERRVHDCGGCGTRPRRDIRLYCNFECNGCRIVLPGRWQ